MRVKPAADCGHFSDHSRSSMELGDLAMMSEELSKALDAMVERPGGMYGEFKDIPLISQKGHARRVELLDALEIGDVRRMTIVDFGMGAWGFGSVYEKLQHCARAIGMDVSRSALDMSKKLAAENRAPYCDNFEVYQSDGMHLPIETASVDLFFSGESIEHVSFPPRFLSEVYRVLKDDGQFIVTTPNRDAVKYREAGEEYCTSPEHFWLFNWPELERTLSEFFEIKVALGFNGSFGGLEEDYAEQDETRCEKWSREFLHDPKNATGIVAHLKKRPNVRYRYEISGIPEDRITFEGVEKKLPLEFGLKGHLLTAESKVTITRPASDGVVCRFWCHRWSGRTIISTQRTLDRVDLYAAIPGWRQWTGGETTTLDTRMSIWVSSQRNAKAEANEVIFFEAFTWSRVPIKGAVAKSQPRNLTQPGYGFERFKVFVGTTVFLWFGVSEGNLSGPWQPLGGRRNWTGNIDFWERQIREMMMANIDAIYVHCFDAFRQQRDAFFAAYHNLRSEGWDVPKIAPFLDPYNLWRETPIDASTEEGKREFARPYLDFFEHYLAHNIDPSAAQYLLTIDGKLVLSTWWVTGLVKNIASLSRGDVEQHLAPLEQKLPQLKLGIYMMSDALINPDLTFSDERAVMFSGYTYAIHSVHETVDVWHVQAGYWDQNIRSPGYMLPRSGGTNYRSAWDIVAANMPGVHRVYVESWNEYDEGSGIYAAEPEDLYVRESMHANSDTFSWDLDPYEYIRTTANGASKINGRPDYSAQILTLDAPTTAGRGDTVKIIARVRNEGNVAWTRGSDIGLAVSIAGVEVTLEHFDLGCNCGPADDVGVVRGQVVTVTTLATIPEGIGGASLTLNVVRSGKPISAGVRAELAISA